MKKRPHYDILKKRAILLTKETSLDNTPNEITKKPAEELRGTTLGMSNSSNPSFELDSLIAETLNESKGLGIEIKQKETAGFAATPMTIVQPKPVEEKKPQPIIEHVISPSAPVVQKTEPAPKKDVPQNLDMEIKNYRIGDIVKGTVVSVDPSGALIDIQYKSDGFLEASEFVGKTIKAGDVLNVYIVSLSTKEGHIALSLKQAEIENDWRTLYDSYKFKKALDVKVTSAVGGGLVVDYNGIRGFVPASHVSKAPETQFAEFVGKIIPVKVIEIDRRQSKVIMSHRFGNAEQQVVDRDKLFNQIEVGSVLHGKVSSIKKFGVFVNVNGLEGLVHINEMSWKKVADPTKVVSVGQEIDVFVIGVDKMSKKLSFGLRQLQPDPWATIAEKYKSDQIIDVKILRIAKFGAFAELEEGIEGLIHNSEISSKGVANAAEVIKPGDIVKAKILRVIPEEHKIGLSIREVEMDEQKSELKQAQESMQPQKITIGDTISNNMKEHLASQSTSQPEEQTSGENELSKSA